MDLMNPGNQKHWGVNFTNLVKDLQTIELRRFAHCESTDDALTCVELATSFVRAAIQSDRSAFTKLEERTVSGLERFMISASPSDPGTIKRFFDLKRANQTLRPLPIMLTWMWPEEEDKLRQLFNAMCASDGPTVL